MGKKIMLVILLFCISLSGTASVAGAEKENEISFVEEYWNKISEALGMKRENSFLEKLEQKGIYYQFQGNNRMSKSVGENMTEYVYDIHDRVIEEICSTDSVAYQYDEKGVLVTVTYHNTVYYAETDENGTVTKLLNEKNECVAEYFYMNGIPSVVSEDRGGTYDLLVGEVNKIRLYSFYYDTETGYYYTYGRFYDAGTGTFVDKLSGDGMTAVNYKVAQKRDTVTNLGNQVTQWAGYLLNGNAQYGTPIPAGSNWYGSLSDVEVLARLIYGENPYNRQDQKAVMWVLLNRYYAGYYASTLRGIATAPGQFSSICDGGKDARIPDTSSSAWKYATWLACAICTTTIESECISLVNKPEGITNQKDFRALAGLVSRCRDSGNGYIILENSYGDSKIMNVVIVGDLYNENYEEETEEFWKSHVVNATQVEHLTINSVCKLGIGYHNVFFNEYPIN